MGICWRDKMLRGVLPGAQGAAETSRVVRALTHHLRLNVAIVILACPYEAATGAHGEGNHLVNTFTFRTSPNQQC
eukprot:6239039-Amphidinium_carterae.1